MNVNFIALIIICFKEIYSWNSILQNSLLVVPFAQISYGNPLNNFLHPQKLWKRSQDSTSSLLNNEQTTIDDIFSKSTSLIPTTGLSVINSENIAPITAAVQEEEVTTIIPKEEIDTSSNFMEETTTLAPIVIVKNNTVANINSSKTSQSLQNVTSHPPSLELTTILSTSHKVFQTTENIDEFTTVQPFTSPDTTPVESSSHYMIIGFSVIAVLGLIGYVVYRFYQKEQVRRLRLQLMPVYNFDPTESDDWESNLLEENCLRPNNKKSPPASSPTDSSSSPSRGTSGATTDPLQQRPTVPVTYL